MPSTARCALALLLLPQACSALAGFGKAAKKPSAKKAAGSFDGKKSFEMQMRSWNTLHEDGKKADEVDVYVRSAKSDKFWFVGKSAARAGACDDAAAYSAVVQKRLCLEHAKLLKLELRTAKTLQLWCAPGNTEMKVAQKMIGLRPLDGLKGAREALPLDECGFMPEQYEKANGEMEQGFYVRLPDDGQPAKGEVSSVKVMSPEELEEMQNLGAIGK